MRKINICFVFLLLFSFLFAKDKEDEFAKLSSRETQIPTNINIQISDDTVTISWDSVIGAISYKVYGSDNPEDNYIDISNLGTFNDTTWTTNLSEDTKKFYYVTSVSKANLDITATDGVVILLWETVPNASSYKVYSSDEINGVFSDVSDTGAFNGSSWVQNVSQYDLKFYYFTSIINGSETEPSKEVGFKKFSCQTTNSTNLNFISLPFSQNGILASEFATAIGDCDAVSKWNAEKQCWESANNAGYKWLNDFQVQNGYPYMINITENKNIYIAGKIIQQPSYNLITTAGTNLNSIMVPLDRNDFTMASQIGDEIGVANQIAKFDSSSQQWTSAIHGPFGWAGDFPVSVGEALMVWVESDIVWPNPSKNDKK